MSGTGVTVLQDGTTLTISGNNTLDTRTLDNESGTVMQDTSTLTLVNGAVINNDGGAGTWHRRPTACS